MPDLAPLDLAPETTALVVIDLQRGIASRQVAPHSAGQVLERAARLAAQFRRRNATVVLVRVAFSKDDRDRLVQPADEAPPSATVPADFSELMPALDHQPSDLVITKRQWGAFYGTELDLQLRRRGVRTLVMCGISTNFGVESTARDGWERGYAIVFAEDAMAGMSAEAHQFAISTTFRRLGRIRSTDQVLSAMGALPGRRSGESGRRTSGEHRTG
jgi:nicotinamidase-related amidase